MQWSWLSKTELGPNDRGLAYGDGVFETLAISAGQLQRFTRHRRRLAAGLERLKIPSDDILQELDATLPQLASRHDAAVAKVIVTRGSSERGYRPPAHPSPVVQVGIGKKALLPAADYLTGIRVGLCDTPVSHAPHLAGVKHLNRLDQVMAAGECQPAWDEGLMFDPDGYLIGGTKTNIFLCTDGGLLTPRLDRCGIAGIMREVVMEAARQLGIGVREMRLRKPHLQAAEGVFLTNTLVGAWPVARIEAAAYPLPPLLIPLREEMERY
jgi:4-amino-4-deoxychorismate lyase